MSNGKSPKTKCTLFLEPSILYSYNIIWRRGLTQVYRPRALQYTGWVTELNNVMALSNLPNFPTSDVDTNEFSCETRWEKWLSRLESLFVGLNTKDEAQKRALLLHYAGEKVSDIYETEKGDDNGTTYDGTKNVLDTYFALQRYTNGDFYIPVP